MKRFKLNLINKFDNKFAPENVNLTDEATVLFTSGTTNLPKGVISTHSNYINKIKSVSSILRLNSNDRHYLTLPLFHTNGQYSLLAVLLKGGSAVICSRFSASNYFKIAVKYKVTLSTLFASTIRMLLISKKYKYEQNNNIRLIMFAQSVSEEELKTCYFSDEIAALLVNEGNYNNILKTSEEKLYNVRNSSVTHSDTIISDGSN